MSDPRTVFWHRRDLRATDNVGLSRAADAGQVVPVFVLDGQVLDHAAPPRVAYLLDALASLRAQYRERGSDLLVARGDPASVLPAVAERHDASRVAWNEDYSGLARERDARVRSTLDDASLECRTASDLLLHDPGTITTNDGDYYQVFSYFWKKWRGRDAAASRPAPAPDSVASVAGDGLPAANDLGFDEPSADVLDGSREAARSRLDAFCGAPIYEYDEAREYPARGGTSRLSQDLKFGTLGVREVAERVDEAHAAAPDQAARDAVEAFRRQLAWREFYAHVLAAEPTVVTEDFREFERPVEWRDDPDGLAAWKAGETGYPIVDAGMRQLRRDGHLHNRVRMIAASFLTKDLLIDWREGYAWFRERLVDHDPANDSGGWQWAAGTGTDAQPYFRVFNPATQCERYDPEGTYVRRHVPELADATAAEIHEWPDLSAAERREIAPAYPGPVVDHAAARERAIAAFERAREGA